MERLMSLKNQIVSAVEGQMGNLQCVDYEELGAAVDMIKDLAEATYYCTITEAMKKQENQPKEISYYTEMPYYPKEKYYMRNEYYPERDLDQYSGKMYYSEGSGNSASMSSSTGTGRNSNYYGNMLRDSREGQSPMHRKMYMESKEMHKDAQTQMRELERYMTELSGDITEMISGATHEEKQMLQQKLNTLASKIV